MEVRPGRDGRFPERGERQEVRGTLDPRVREPVPGRLSQQTAGDQLAAQHHRHQRDQDRTEGAGRQRDRSGQGPGHGNPHRGVRHAVERRQHSPQEQAGGHEQQPAAGAPRLPPRLQADRGQHGHRQDRPEAEPFRLVQVELADRRSVEMRGQPRGHRPDGQRVADAPDQGEGHRQRPVPTTPPRRQGQHQRRRAHVRSRRAGQRERPVRVAGRADPKREGMPPGQLGRPDLDPAVPEGQGGPGQVGQPRHQPGNVHHRECGHQQPHQGHRGSAAAAPGPHVRCPANRDEHQQGERGDDQPVREVGRGGLPPGQRGCGGPGQPGRPRIGS